MKTDRELLELAAKAAGVEHAICYEANPEDGFPTAYAKTNKRTYWNPLADDGDALRLAVKLELDLKIAGDGCLAGDIYSDYWYSYEEYGIDKMKAVRRAIVLAAADMGAAK